MIFYKEGLMHIKCCMCQALCLVQSVCSFLPMSTGVCRECPAITVSGGLCPHQLQFSS